MNKKEKTLIQIPFFYTFDDIYIVKNNSGIMIDSIKLYSLKKYNNNDGYYIDCKVDFDIKVRDDVKVIIPLKKKEKYMLFCNRIILGYKIEVKAEDYPSNIGNIDFCFKF